MELKKSFLGQILRLRCIADHMQTERVHFLLVCRVELRERLVVASVDSGQYIALLVFGRGIGSNMLSG
jgi:hypothetical protein